MVKLSPGFSFKLIPILSFGIALLGLYLSSIFSYILFHSLVEIISIVIGYNIFILAWNSRNRLDNNYLLFLGIAYLFVCSLDLTHTLAYKGMGVFAGYDANLPTQLWIAARYLQSITLLICPVFLYRKINIQAVIWGYGAVSTALLVAIFMGFFPVCFVEGTGLTPFKIASEYVIILILLVAVVMLVRNRDSFDAEVLRWLVFSLILAISAEAAFTSYISVYGFANLTGHLLKLGSVYFIYKAIIKTGLEEPHRLFFRNLQQNETELKNAQHYAHLGSWTWNIKNDQLEWSDEMFRIFGLERETIPDLSPTVIKNFVHPDDRDKVKQSYQDAARNIFPVPFEFRVVWPDQSLHVVWAEVGELKVDADGKPAQLSGTVQDITERKRLENELLRSEHDLNEAQAIAHIGSWKWDVNSEKVFWSDEMYRIFGIDKNTFNLRLGDIARNAMHPDDLYIVLPENAANIANLPFEYRIILPDGSIRLIWAKAGNTIYDQEGKPTYLMGVAQDITERKRVEGVLKESEERYRLLFHSMESGFALHEIICDAEGVPCDYRFLEINPAFEKLTGLKAEGLVGNTCLEVLPGTEKVWFERYGKVALTGEAAHFENFSMELGKYYEVTAYSPRHGQFAVIFQDVTERKLFTERMVQSQKLADLGTLAAGVAHEVNTPLQIITGSSGKLLESLEKGEENIASFKTRLKRIDQSAWLIAEIVRALLTYSRNSNDQLSESNLNDLVRDTLLLTEHQLHVLSNITIVTDLTADLPGFICDRNKIIQALINLLNNARDAMPQGGTITIRSGYDPEDKKLTLTVNDTGEGIKEGLHTKIFDPFFTTRPLGQGTGLGLSIVMGIAHSHGGEIKVESEPGKGSSFVLSFALVPPIEAENTLQTGRFDEGLS